MNKEEAISAMREGSKVKHRYFDDHEWVKMGGNGFVFEDGVTCTFDEFWRFRSEWVDDWSIFKESLKLDPNQA